MQFNRNNSIWQLSTLWGLGSEPRDGCDLFTSLLVSLAIITLGVLAAGIFLGAIFGELAAMIITGVIIWDSFTVVVSLVAGAFVGILGGLTGSALLWDKVTKSESLATSYKAVKTTITESEPVEFVKETHKSLKEKYCPVVTFKE